MRRRWPLIVAALLIVACSADGEELPQDDAASTPDAEATEPAEPGEEPDPEPEPEPEPCRDDRLEDEPRITLTALDPGRLSAELARRTHRCAETVVLAPDDAPWAAAIAAAVAVHVDGPLLLAPAEGDLPRDELTRLDPEDIVAVGFGDGGLSPQVGGVRITSVGDDGDAVALAREVAEHLQVTTLLAVPEDDVRARAAALARLDDEVALLPLPDGAPLADVANGLAPTVRLRVLATGEGQAAELADELLGVGVDAVAVTGPPFATGTATSWLVDPADEVAAAVTAAAARGRGEALLPIDGEDLRRGRDDTDRLRRTDPARVVLTGDVTADAPWQLDTVLRGAELPWGGFSLFDDDRIMVALYGSPETTVLGAMGEQPLDETVPRLREVAEPYGARGAEVVPAFEIITTIASARAEETGDYSRRTPIETIRPWVDRAAEEGFYVVLDLQPGRTDFLTQAQEYEELLREPHVGLALDPEWRLEPHQVHLQQIGSVSAEEVQQVADWLAALVREHDLPEKLLILHQFRFSMLPDREDIEAPPELAVVVHMDGQGPQGAKDETYAAITRGVEDRWLWGWKNFYDEDEPTATPDKVLDLDPPVVFVSYQ